MEQQLIQQLADRLHISPQMAQQVLGFVLSYLGQHDPQLSGILGMLTGGTSTNSGSSGGGLFGGTTNTTSTPAPSGGGIIGSIIGDIEGMFGRHSNQLQQHLTQNAGLSPQQAQVAIETVTNFARQHASELSSAQGGASAPAANSFTQDAAGDVGRTIDDAINGNR